MSAKASPERGGIDLMPYVVGAICVVIALAFLIYPLAYSMLGAFVQKGEEISLDTLTLAHFERFFVSVSYKRALWNSIVAGGLSTLLAGALALPMAYAVARVAIPFRALILSLSVVPLISPPFIGAYAWIILVGNNGVISQLLRDHLAIDLPSIYGSFGVVVALALKIGRASCRERV